MSEKTTQSVFAHLSGQDDNLGDSALRVAYLEALRGPGRHVHVFLGAATTDLMAPITLALPSGLLGGLSLFWVVLAVVAVLYLTVGTLVLGTTPGLWMMQRVGSHPLGARRLPFTKAPGALVFGEASDEDALDGEATPRQAWNSGV